MADITAQMVKELRERTGAGMMECKAALKEANGDSAEAEVVLRKRGIASAGKKATRSTKQGKIDALLSEGNHLGVLVEVNCESDFVARTDDFGALAADIAAQVASSEPADVAALLGQPYAKDASMKIEDLLKSKIAKVGENMSIARFARYSTTGRIESYIHHGAQLGVLIELGCTPESIAANEEVAELGRDLAMQIAAADPRYIRREDVKQEDIDKEKDIQRARALAEGKPEKIVDKVVDGRMGKFYEEICLLEQPFIKENSIKVDELVKQKANKAGGTVNVVRFVRFKVGDTQAE
jgi:elongation factor Ts